RPNNDGVQAFMDRYQQHCTMLSEPTRRVQSLQAGQVAGNDVGRTRSQKPPIAAEELWGAAFRLLTEIEWGEPPQLSRRRAGRDGLSAIPGMEVPRWQPRLDDDRLRERVRFLA